MQEDIESRLAAIKLGGTSGRELREVNIEKTESGIIYLRFNLPSSGSSDAHFTDGELIFDWAVSQGYKILGMNRKKLSLEDIFVKLTSEPLTSEPHSNELLANKPLTSEPHDSEEKAK